LTDSFHVRVFGLPVAQGRPRAFKLPTGQVRVYDPEPSRDWKRTVLAQILPAKPEIPLAGPLRLSLDFILPRPKTLPKKILAHTRRPDLDNLVKAVKDALRAVVYHDDAQVTELHASKRYGAAPGVEIWLSPDGGPPPLPAGATG